MTSKPADLPTPGFAVLHSNQLEQLRDALVHWMGQQPVPPLGQEEILVQSNGIAQWLKMALAEQHSIGIAAGLTVELPNQFVWQLYRAVLGNDVPRNLPYDKANLTWRLLRLLPQLTDDVYAPLSRYCADDQDGRKTWHLAARLADLFDQYQVYRADWLQAWNRHEDVRVRSKGNLEPLTSDDLWQPALWRALRADMERLAAPSQYSSRADIHQFALEALHHGQLAQPEQLPDRIVVFGISSLPRQTLELLAALGQHRQVLLGVLNPCAHFWGDITGVQDEVRRRQKRQQPKPGLPSPLALEDLHLHAPPLLASWGKQGRDYISLLDEFDQPDRYQDWFGGRIDLFFEPEQDTILAQLQRDILNLNPITTRTLAADDTSLTFHIAHSRQREVEILQDQLIAAFDHDPTLQPRDVIIMMPDISQYAPHIHAVFGRLDSSDPRHLPYTLADQALRGHDPLLIAVEYLLQLPEARLRLSDLLDLMEVPAIQARFGIRLEALPTLKVWLSEAGVRWGLNEAHRDDLELGSVGKSYSWLQGIQRLLLGYAMGEAERWQDELAYPDAGGLAAADLGPVIALIRQLTHWYPQLKADRSVADWVQTLQGETGLLNAFFHFERAADVTLQTRLLSALDDLHQASQFGHFDTTISLAVLRDAWLDGLDQAGLSQRFLAGSLTFSTLLPMRAIPFQRIYLLGMQDGEYPRTRRPDDFDLMATDYRPGDRSRRDDDRYLFLEALLSARQAFSISWVGRQIRDNSEQPASVLVNQLVDVINQGWSIAGLEEAAAALTIEYPLQPFSEAYFNGQFVTYAHEWELEAQTVTMHESDLPPPDEPPELNLAQLEDFLRNPIRHYLKQRFKSRLYRDGLVDDDDEPFQLDSLDTYLLGDRVLQQWLADPGQPLATWIDELQADNRLPLHGFGERAREALLQTLNPITERVVSNLGDAPAPEHQETLSLSLALPELTLNDQLTGLYRRDDELVQLILRPGAVMQDKQPRGETLLRAWVRHLAANAQGTPLTTLQCGSDTHVTLPALAPDLAREQLINLVTCWQTGLQRPLPVVPKTALTWLRTENPGKARAEYEGGYNQSGECSAETARYFPNFEHLEAAGFYDWAERLYGPLLILQKNGDSA